MDNTSIGLLAKKLKVSWPAIAASRAKSRSFRGTLSKLVHTVSPSGDVDFVAYGSIARGEATSGSDVDWTLLIDGSVDGKHQSLKQEIADRLSQAAKKKTLKLPNPDGVFGRLTFSHDLVHKIGGGEDTNHNMTQRMLLLSESIVCGSKGECPSTGSEGSDSTIS
jgi:predicted nucleotidyltransferase